MTHSVTINRYDTIGARKAIYGTVDITSYTASGEVVTASEFAVAVIDNIVINSTEKGYIWWYDADNLKIRAFNPTAAHSHVAFTVNQDETASDKSDFVSITAGDASTAVTAYIANAGGGTAADIDTGDNTVAAGSEVTAGVDIGTASIVVIGY